MALIAIESVWEYQFVANDTPPDPAAVVVPAAGWTPDGLAPFGTAGNFDPDYPINTAWAVDTGLWMRRNVVLDGGLGLILKGRIEQTFYLYFDGTFVGGFNLDNSSRTDVPEYTVVIPAELCTAGTHEVALLCLDESSTSAGDTTYIYVEADYLPGLLPLQPRTPAKETLEWLTDVQVSKDGTEQRLKIMVSPRQAFEFTYPADAVRKQMAFNTIYGQLPKEWLVPVWTQAQRKGAIAAGLTTLSSVVTSIYEFRDNSLILLWESPEKWQVIAIDTVGGSSLVLNNPTDAFDDAWLMPLRFGFMPDNATKKFNGYDAEFSLRFNITDNAELTVSAPTQYQSNDLYTDEGLLNGDSLSDDILSPIDIHDPGMGLVAFYQNWTHSKVARTHRVVCEDAAETWALRQFLHRRAGRYKAFYQPSFENDLVLESTGTIVSTITVKDDGYAALMSEHRTHLAIQVGSTWYARAILSHMFADGDSVQLTLDSALNVAATDVRRVCWLGLKRLNTDRVEIRYIGGGVAQSEFRVLEISG